VASFPTDLDCVVRHTLAEYEPLALGEAVNSLQEPPRRIIPLHPVRVRGLCSQLGYWFAPEHASLESVVNTEL